MLVRALALVGTIALAAPSALAADAPIRIVAAETFYGEVAAAIGGSGVDVESIAISPDADPHDFAPPPSVARTVADADIVVMNGLDYDHWMESLVEAAPKDGRTVVDVAELLGATPGGNPHLWYDPKAVPALAKALAEELAARDPGNAAGYGERLAAYDASLGTLSAQIAEIRGRFAGTPVIASEPVFGLMAEALGLDMLGDDFQRAVMNETEPSPKAIAAVEDDIRSGRARVLFYNHQVVDPLTERLLAIAEDAKVPVVAVTESMPAGSTYVDWMRSQLDATARALAAPAS